MYLRMTLQPAIFSCLVSVQVVQYHVHLALRVSGDDLVHKIQELATAAAIVAGFHLSRDHVRTGGHLKTERIVRKYWAEISKFVR